MTTRERIIAEAEKCLGVASGREFIALAAPAYGPSDNPSWCGIFVRAIWMRAGLWLPDWKIGSANLSYLKPTADPQPGDLVMWRGGLGHQSMFFRRVGDFIESIDGNSRDPATGRTGVVCRRTRHKREVLAFYSAPFHAENVDEGKA